LIAVTLAILVATLYPAGKSVPFNIWNYDKLGHFIMFGIWTFMYGLYRFTKKDGKPKLWIIFMLGSFYGLLIEVLQFALPTNRSPEAFDLLADVLGSLAAIILLRYLFNSLSKKNKEPAN